MSDSLINRAQVLMRQAFNTSQPTFLGVISSLAQRLQSVVQNKDMKQKYERSQLQQDLNLSKQCLEVCKIAGEVSRQNIHTIGEADAEDNSDQVVVTTIADLFHVHKAHSKNFSAQLTATLTPANFDHVVDKRYDSRFGALPDRSDSAHVSSSVWPYGSDLESSERPKSIKTGIKKHSLEVEARNDKAHSNEKRKRLRRDTSE